MNIEIHTLLETDLQRVDDLGRPYRNTLGFLTLETLREYLQKKRVLGAVTHDGELVGYLLFADYADYFRIAQLCVTASHRNQGIARKLVESLQSKATTQKRITLRCRRDFEAACNTWKNLGFIPVNERQGRSAEGLPLTTFYFRLAHDDELGLWAASESESMLDIVIDAQILLDFYAPDTSNTLISKALFNDALGDSLKLWITDEMFVEIDRQSSTGIRTQSRDLANNMAMVFHQQTLANKFLCLLKKILPYDTNSSKSDVQHLAKTAASEIKVFVTKDERLLKKAEVIKSQTGVVVLHPTEVIKTINETSNPHFYSTLRVNGLRLYWNKTQDKDLRTDSFSRLQKQDENKGRLREKIYSYLSYPQKYQCETLWDYDKMLAIRVYEHVDDDCINVPFIRVVSDANDDTYKLFLIADTLSLAINKNREIIKLCSVELQPFMIPMLLHTGFSKHQDDWIKFSIPKVLCKDDVLSYIRVKAPLIYNEYQCLQNIELEHICSPLISYEEIPTFIIPIRPAFAMGLIDNQLAKDDFWGGKPSVLLRWDNVYFRAKSCHLVLRAPGRILWYESGNEKKIIAISHLEEVETGLPKDLFKKYQKLGVYEWRDIYDTCHKKIDIEIMALRFSRTFLFKVPIPLAKLRKIAQEESVALALQSPRLIPFSMLERIFNYGFNKENHYEQ